MADAMQEMLAAGDYTGLATGWFVGLACALFTALMWLRVWRWIFGLFGLRA